MGERAGAERTEDALGNGQGRFPGGGEPGKEAASGPPPPNRGPTAGGGSGQGRDRPSLLGSVRLRLVPRGRFDVDEEGAVQAIQGAHRQQVDLPFE